MGQTSLPVFYKGRPIYFSVEQMQAAVMTISALQMMRTITNDENLGEVH